MTGIATFDLVRATCRRCDYPLRDLPSSRCPECGQRFDARDPLSVRLPHVPRLVQRVLQGSTHWRTDRARWCSLAAIVWGLMLLPGGYYVATAGVGAMLVAFPLRACGWLCRRGLARMFRTTCGCDRRSPYTWAALLLLAAAASTGLPTKLALIMHAPLLNAYAVRVHEREPFIGQRIVTPRLIGLLFVVAVHNAPSGLTLLVGPGIALHYDPEGFDGKAGALGSRWLIEYFHPHAPWSRRYC